jgi:SAM-dependent methyltransferase
MNERWSLAAGHVPDALVLVLLTGAVLLAVAEGVAAFGRPRGGTPRRLAMGLLGLRLCALGALVAVAFELTLRIEEVTPAGRRLVVLVDRSASMALADATAEGQAPEARQARLERAWQGSADARVGWRDEGLTVDVRGFSLQTTPLTGTVAETLAGQPDGAASDLARALAELQEPEPDRAPLAAVVVLSDGLVAEDGATDAHLMATAEALGVPVTTLSVGAPVLRDASVAEVRAGEFAFVENVTELEAVIVAHGLRGTAAAVELRRDGEVVATQPLRLGADGEPTPVRFEVAPDRVGQFVYEIAVPPQEGEATLANNGRAFVVKVLRDKVRVLHVAGRPDWDVRALRTLLRRDPNVELLSYYILRGFDDIAREDTTAALSLIAFPTDELFEKELGSFDLVVLHNFDAVQHQVEQYLDNIARYVEEGGALVLIGGDLAFSDRGYGLPEIAALLPVDTRGRIPLERGSLRPALTEAGRRHPITAWLAATDEGWAQLPPLDDHNPLAPSPRGDLIGAAALLVHPDDTGAHERPRPLLAVSEPGRGRVMVLATGSTWRLGFAPDLPLIDGARPYDLLWLGAVRWLLRDDTSGRLTLETNKPRYLVGEAVELQAKTWSASYAAEPGVTVEWAVRPLVQTDDGQPPPALHEGQWVTDGLGRARQPLEALPVGSYVAQASRESADAATAGTATSKPGAALDTDALGHHEVRRVFIVEPPGRELARVDADPGIERLARMAERTGGQALSAADGDTLPRRLPLAEPSTRARDGMRVDARRDLPLWNGWLALVLLVATFGGEWLLRRRQGEA